ncbi:meiotic recombination protein REC8, fungi type [Rhodotorula toruloides]|uniref:Meiotic recombination protein REC8, fungi type n=1 Tax=Rhodotorula toruloides TaxID=5286 RepID=A0A511K7N8_RHOTO|nr:meiotic recombination protein REC8, fungi type [Rhodotorula toruloides]
MFYNTEILTSRKGGFAIFWLAATVGSRGGTAVRKLSKKELLSCNVVKACEKVAAPDEPLALRLSSNLMVGIARVYQQQYTIYASDVTHMHATLKKVVTESAFNLPDITVQPEIARPLTPRKGLQEPTGKEAAGGGGLNLAFNQGIALTGFDPDWDLGILWRLPGEEYADEMEVLEEGMFTSPAPSIAGAPAADRQPKGAHQAPEADITLAEPHLRDYLLRGFEGADEFGQAGFEGELELGAIFGEEEQGLLYGISPELDAAIRAGSAGRGSAAGSARGPAGFGASSSAVGYSADLGGFNDHFAGQEFGGGGDEFFPQVQQRPNEGEETFTERVRKEHEEAQARLQQAGGRRSATPLGEVNLSAEFNSVGDGTPSTTTRKRVSDALEQAQTKAMETKKAAKKAKRAKLIPIDRSTELTDDQFRWMHATYSDRMDAERKKADKAREEREAHQKAVEAIFGVPAAFQIPGLAEFWKETVVGQMTPFEGAKAADEKKRRVAGLAPKKRKARNSDVAQEGEQPREAGKRLSEQPGVDAAFGGFGFGAQNFFAGQEFGSGAEYVHGGDMGGFEHEIFDQDIEIGRAARGASLTGSGRPSMLPWAAELPTSEAGGVGGFGLAVGGPSSAAGVSMETPLPRGLVQYRSRTPSLHATPLPGGSVEALLEEGEELVGVEGGSPMARSGEADSEEVLPETDSYRFLNYARRHAAALPAGDQFFFSDIVPTAVTTPTIAAAAFYHLLTLAMKGEVRVEQKDPYGEIAVEV